MTISSFVQSPPAASQAPAQGVNTPSLRGSLYDVAKLIAHAMEKQTAYTVDSLSYTQKLNAANIELEEKQKGDVAHLSKMVEISQDLSYVAIGLTVVMLPLSVAISPLVAGMGAADGALSASAAAVVQTASQCAQAISSGVGVATSAAQGVSNGGTGIAQAQVTKDRSYTDLVSTLSGDENDNIRGQFKAQALPGQALNQAISSFRQITEHKI